MNIGFLCPEINQNQADHEILQAINGLCEDRPLDNIVLFNNNYNTVDPNKKYYILPVSHSKYFKGILFVFDTESASLSITFPGPTKQVLVLKQLEWVDKHDLPYTLWYNIYMNSNLEIVVSNQTDYDLTSICWKQPIAINNGLTAKGLQDVIRQLQ